MVLAVVLQVIGLALVAVAVGFVHPACSLGVVGAAVFAAGFDHERRR